MSNTRSASSSRRNDEACAAERPPPSEALDGKSGREEWAGRVGGKSGQRDGWGENGNVWHLGQDGESVTCGGWDRGESPSSGSEAATPHGAAVALAVMRLKWPLRLVSVLPLLFSVLPLLFSVLPLLESPIAPPPLPSIRPPLPPIRPLPPSLPPSVLHLHRPGGRALPLVLRRRARRGAHPSRQHPSRHHSDHASPAWAFEALRRGHSHRSRRSA